MIYRKTIIEKGLYHVTQRAPGRELLFIEEDDYLRFLKLLKETSCKFSLDIFCFALMSNHAHILLQIKDRNLDKGMKYLFQSYAQSFNKKYQRKGHVFCGVYRASFCRDEAHLITASLYIHLNPYKAKLTSNPFEYRWFSLQPYINEGRASFLKTDYILGLLNDKNRQEARNIYKKLIEESTAFKYKSFSLDQRVEKNFFNKFLMWFSKNSTKIEFRKIRSFASYLELEKKIEDIQKTKRFTKPASKKAILYLISQLKARGYSTNEIVEHLNISRATMYRMLK